MMATDVIPVRVAIRVRPFSNREKAENSKECVQCFVEQGQIAINGKVFAFDSVFDPSTSQETVYDVCAAPLLEKIFDGYNCTILAYGQTGSGKTYTMGTEETPRTMQSEQRGIISRIVDGIFKHIATSQTHRVSASMLEIYEEKVIDLLCATRECLQIRELKGTVFVQGLSVHPVSSLEDCISLLEKGCQLRSKGETAMNDKSSRSHAIFTLSIEGKESEQSAAFKSKLHLVDLVGSERLKKTQSEGERMREAIKINEGLLALGNVIATLSDQNSAGRYVPYRDAKITRLLQDSLGGNSYTVMITCVSPADTNAEETLSTLRYAERVKGIRNKPIVNIDPSMATIQNLREELANAKHELAMLRAGGAQISAGDVSMAPCKRCDKLKEQIQKLFDDYNHRHRLLAVQMTEMTKFVRHLHVVDEVLRALWDDTKDINAGDVSMEPCKRCDKLKKQNRKLLDNFNYWSARYINSAADIAKFMVHLLAAEQTIEALRDNIKDINAGDVSMGPCKRCDELKKQNQKLLDDYNHRKVQLVESVDEIEKFVARFFAAEQTVEALRDNTNINADNVSMGPCKRCDELKKRNQKLLDNHNYWNMKYMQSVAEVAKVVLQLFAAQQTIVALRDNTKHINAGDVSMGPCKRCDKLKKRNQKLLDNFNCRNIKHVQSAAETAKLVMDLLTVQQAIEALRDNIKDIKSKCKSNDFDEAMKIADMALKLQGPAEEETDKEIDEIGDDDGDDETSDQAFVNHFTERANVLAEIKQKETAFEATTVAQAELDKMRAAHAAELIELQAQLDAKEKEKQELLNKLKG